MCEPGKNYRQNCKLSLNIVLTKQNLTVSASSAIFIFVIAFWVYGLTQFGQTTFRNTRPTFSLTLRCLLTDVVGRYPSISKLSNLWALTPEKDWELVLAQLKVCVSLKPFQLCCCLF